MSIELGHTYRDRVTGFIGVAIGYVQYITGCNQALLSPPVGTDGSLRDSNWFDVQRLEQTDAPALVLDNGEHPGFEKAPPRI